MTDHVQQQILDYVRTTLRAANTAAGTDVYLDQVDPLEATKLPAINIEGGNEEIVLNTLHSSAVQQRNFEFTVSCIVAQANGAPKAARNLGGEVETALLSTVAASTAGGLCSSLRITAAEPFKDGSAATVCFEARQTWACTYFTQEGAPTVAL